MSQPEFYLASGNRLALGYWFGFILCIISFGCCLLLIYIDIKADTSVVTLEVPILIKTDENEKFEDEEEVEEEIKLSDYKQFTLPYWLLAGNCCAIYMSFMSFMNIASDLLQNRFSFGSEEAGIVLVIFIQNL